MKKKTTFTQVLPYFAGSIPKLKKSFTFYRRIQCRIRFSTPSARRLSADNGEPFRCVLLCLEVSPNRGYFSLLMVNSVSFQLFLSPEMSRDDSRNTRLTLSTLQRAVPASVEAGSMCAAFNVPGNPSLHGVPARTEHWEPRTCASCPQPRKQNQHVFTSSHCFLLEGRQLGRETQERWQVPKKCKK